MSDQGERGRHDERAADALPDAADDQDDRIRGEPAHQGADAELRNPAATRSGST